MRTSRDDVGVRDEARDGTEAELGMGGGTQWHGGTSKCEAEEYEGECECECESEGEGNGKGERVGGGCGYERN
jgi:hypothetical protein